jgi:predicted Zn-dependent protease
VRPEQPSSCVSGTQCAPTRIDANRIARFAAAALIAVLLADCSRLESFLNGRSMVLPDAPKHQAAKDTPEQREHNRILAAYGGAYEDARLSALIGRTIDRLVAASERPDLRYKVTILNSPSVNAFALPSGNLYITRGLLALANDNAELASVLAHEMAHVIARHASIRENQMKQAAAISRVAGDVMADPQMGALALAKSKITLASFSRAQEFEADGIGVGISSRAGFDPYGATRFLTSMGRNAEIKSAASKNEVQAPEFLSSHPATPERIENARLNARQYVASGAPERDKNAYLAAINGMVFGEDPSEGFVRGRRFLHPKLGFTFMAPEGFTLDNTSQAVFGVRQAGEQALRLDVVRVASEESLSAYLASGWIENIDPVTVEEVTINGLKAATAMAKTDTWVFRLYAVRFGSEVYRLIFAAKNQTPELDAMFRECVASFRRMSAAEIKQAKPLRLKVLTVGPADSIERYASRMPVDQPAERFRILNGLDSSRNISPGDKVKIIVE